MSLSTIRTILINDPTVSAIVGTKVFVGFATQETKAPFIVLEETFEEPIDCKEEAAVIDEYNFIVTAVSPQYKEVEEILTGARNALNDYNDNIYHGIRFTGLQEVYDGIQDYFLKTHSYRSIINIL